MFGGTDDNYLAGFGKRWQLSWELSQTAIVGNYVPAEGTAGVKALRWEWTNDLRNREPECGECRGIHTWWTQGDGQLLQYLRPPLGVSKKVRLVLGNKWRILNYWDVMWLSFWKDHFNYFVESGFRRVSVAPNLAPPAYLGGDVAAKSRQSCPTLCDPIDGSPSGSPIAGILQARILEWFAISFSSAWKWSCSVVSNSLWLQPTRLLYPWDFPGKSTEVSCHCLLQIGILKWNIMVTWTKVVDKKVWSTGDRLRLYVENR